jgi:hypothetical protein
MAQVLQQGMMTERNQNRNVEEALVHLKMEKAQITSGLTNNIFLMLSL